MAGGFNGNGVYIRYYDWTNDAAGNIKIRADRMDTEDDGFATGLSTCITKDGQTTITNNLPMSSFRHTGASDAVNKQDYLTLNQAMNGTGKYASSVGGTGDIITIGFSPTFTAYTAGMQISFVASAVNTTNVTINVDGLGAKAITKNGTTALIGGDIPSGAIVLIEYDGTRFQLLSISASNAVSGYLLLTGGSLSGALNLAKGTDIASSGTTNIGAATGNYVNITGTTTITAFDIVQAGTHRWVQFTGILTLTYNATSLILPTSANIVTVAGDTALFVSLGSGNWKCASYNRANGSAVSEKIVQRVISQPTAFATTTTQIPLDDTIPQITEGAEFITVTITPTSSTNRLLIRSNVMISSSTATNTGIVALFQDATANALSAAATNLNNNTVPSNIPLEYEMAAGTTSATTFRIRSGTNSAGTTTFNGSAGGRVFGAIPKSFLIVEEYAQ